LSGTVETEALSASDDDSVYSRYWLTNLRTGAEIRPRTSKERCTRVSDLLCLFENEGGNSGPSCNQPFGYTEGDTMNSQSIILWWRLRACTLVAGSFSLFLLVAHAQGQAVIATVPVGKQPMAVAVNPVTNKIYVGNGISNNVTVIDGATNSTRTVTDPNASFPIGVAVNPVTNKIYIANLNSNNVTVIDGTTHSAMTVTDPNAIRPIALAVNSATNKIYVANEGNNVNNFGNVTVIDGASNSTSTVTDLHANNPFAIGVNPVTNKIYVANMRSSTATVIDGATNTASSIIVPISHAAVVAVNPTTNKIYMPQNYIGGAVTVINGATNSTRTVTDPNAVQPQALAVNPMTNKIYVGNGVSNNVTVIDGATNSTRTVTDPNASFPIAVAVNPVTNKIFVKNINFTVTAIDGPTNTTVNLTTPSSLNSLISPNLVAVNAVTDRIYEVNYGSDNVTVIAGSQASCKVTFFPLMLNVPNVGNVSLSPAAINDFGTVVGDAVLENGSSVGFIRWSNGGIDFPLGKNVKSSLTDRNDSGISIGFKGPEQILLSGTTATPIVLNLKNIGFLASGINNSGSIVGTYFIFDSGRILEHGFKRSSNGSVMTIDFPGSNGSSGLDRINDNGTIIGNFNTIDENSHGFIYRKGSFARLDYPSSTWTGLLGISNAGMIVGNTKVSGSVFPFLYQDGLFKVISPPRAFATIVLDISPRLGLIMGDAVFKTGPNKGFIAKCQ
jgi:YVTN family beta-propeller protein